MRPAAQSAADQADAAYRDAEHLIRQLGALTGAVYRPARPVGPVGAILDRLVDRAAAWDLTACDHLMPPHELAYWCAWRPSRLRCLKCADRVNRDVQGTREEYVCDGCRRHSPRACHAMQILVPSAVLDTGDGPAMWTAPIIVGFGLCPRCKRESEHADTVSSTTN